MSIVDQPIMGAARGINLSTVVISVNHYKFIQAGQ